MYSLPEKVFYLGEMGTFRASLGGWTCFIPLASGPLSEGGLIAFYWHQYPSEKVDSLHPLGIIIILRRWTVSFPLMASRPLSEGGLTHCFSLTSGPLSGIGTFFRRWTLCIPLASGLLLECGLLEFPWHQDFPQKVDSLLSPGVRTSLRRWTFCIPLAPGPLLKGELFAFLSVMTCLSR